MAETWDGTREGADRIFEQETREPQTERQLVASLDAWVMRMALIRDREKEVGTTSERE